MNSIAQDHEFVVYADSCGMTREKDNEFYENI